MPDSDLQQQLDALARRLDALEAEAASANRIATAPGSGLLVHSDKFGHTIELRPPPPNF